MVVDFDERTHQMRHLHTKDLHSPTSVKYWLQILGHKGTGILAIPESAQVLSREVGRAKNWQRGKVCQP